CRDRRPTEKDAPVLSSPRPVRRSRRVLGSLTALAAVTALTLTACTSGDGEDGGETSAADFTPVKPGGTYLDAAAAEAAIGQVANQGR
ncbi:MAG: hypothetical protein L0L93_02605, partial [Brevibacterium sp.]|nr:hypothetical protein [Brevibacterium sp.]